MVGLYLSYRKVIRLPYCAGQCNRIFVMSATNFRAILNRSSAISGCYRVIPQKVYIPFDGITLPVGPEGFYHDIVDALRHIFAMKLTVPTAVYAVPFIEFLSPTVVNLGMELYNAAAA